MPKLVHIETHRTAELVGSATQVGAQYALHRFSGHERGRLANVALATQAAGKYIPVSALPLARECGAMQTVHGLCPSPTTAAIWNAFPSAPNRLDPRHKLQNVARTSGQLDSPPCSETSKLKKSLNRFP